MYILALNGSPHQEGNTAFLLKTALAAAAEAGAETEIVHVEAIMATQKTPYCRVCSSPCTGACYRGTEVEAVFERMRRAGGIILGSPVYFGTVSAPLKGFWDKSRLLRTGKALLNTVGAALSCARTRFGGQETTLRALHDLMLVQGMILVGDGHRDFDAGHHGVCAQQPATGDANARERARILGLRVAEIARATASLRCLPR